MITTFKNIISGILISVLISCSSGNSTAEANEQKEPLKLSESTPPFQLDGEGDRFYSDIQYGEYNANKFDIFLPDSDEPTPLAIYIHGGAGNKTTPYEEDGGQRKINEFLSNNIAYATINYRMLDDIDTLGVMKCINDSKRALQFMRYHAEAFNVDKENIVLMGASLGGGQSLWIGLHDEMADKSNEDLVLRESTRVKGIIAMETQANYDLLEWHNNVFSEYQDEGFDGEYAGNIGGRKDKIYSFFGVDRDTDIYAESFKSYRDTLNMLKMMSSDDPELYIANAKLPYRLPKRTGELTHHPLHAKALMDRASETGVKGKFYIPKMDIDTRDGESQVDFVVRLTKADRK